MEDSSIMKKNITRIVIVLMAIVVWSAAPASAQLRTTPVPLAPNAAPNTQAPAATAPAPSPVPTPPSATPETGQFVKPYAEPARDFPTTQTPAAPNTTPTAPTSGFPWGTALLWLLGIIALILFVRWLLNRPQKTNHATGGGADPEPRSTPRPAQRDPAATVRVAPRAAPATPAVPATEPRPQAAPAATRDEPQTELLGRRDPAAAATPEPKKVVVISSRATALYHIEEAMRDAGLTVTVVRRNIGDDVRRIRETDPELVLIDANEKHSDERDGYTLASELVLTNVLLFGNDLAPVDVAKAREAHVLGILPEPKNANRPAMGAMLKAVLNGEHPANLWPESNGSGSTAPIVAIAFLILGGFAQAVQAQGIDKVTPNVVVTGYNAQSYTMQVSGACDPLAILSSQPSNMVAFTDPKRVGDQITFKAQAAENARTEPMQLKVTCKGGQTLSSGSNPVLAVMSRADNYVGYTVTERLMAELKSRDAQIAQLKREVEAVKNDVNRDKKTQADALKKMGDQLAALKSEQAKFATITVVDEKVSRSAMTLEKTVNARIDSVATAQRDTDNKVRAALEALNGQVVEVANRDLQTRDALLALGAVVDPMAPKVKTGGFLGIGKKPVVSQDAYDAMRARLAELGAKPADPNKDR